MTEYKLVQVGIHRPDKRRGENADKPDVYIAFSLEVGKRSRYEDLIVPPAQALQFAEELIRGARMVMREEAERP